MRKKASTLMTNMLVALIVLGIVVIIYVVFFVKAAAVSSDPIVAQCQQSAALAGIVRTPLVDAKILDFNCPVSHTTITKGSLQANIDANKMKTYGYSNAQTYNLNKQMWQQAVQCYQKVNFGTMALFSRNILTVTQPTYCVVCSVVTFDDDARQDLEKNDPNSQVTVVINNQNTDIAPFVTKENILGFGKPLSQIISERNDTVGAANTNFNYEHSQAIVYYRTQVKWFGKLANKFPALKTVGGIASADLSTYLALAGGYNSLPLGISGIVNSINAYPTQDVDGLLFVNYDATQRDALNNVCNIIGNEPYINK